MIERPAFFERIRAKAASRWDQLESDAELAGPWYQLFKQVQSPRHVLSELLQNADDAGAREASAWIENDAFHFEHDGEDFTEAHFESLCRFGYSNKRQLHTIGFRGIGFKSTFSLGDRVEVFTPTLAVEFDSRRFTEPRWSSSGVRSDHRTCIRVEIKDQHRWRELEQNLEEWRQSPLSLLFFKNIRRMRVGGAEVAWSSVGSGPVLESEWMALEEGEGERFLLIRSPAEPFPEEALDEMRRERLLREEDTTDFPPARVEIVVGAQGRLFVVLPTGVETTLPFACNAPFIQDPARLKIKDPETSPTNRWLLQRAGELAAASMLAWSGRSDIPEAERAAAYGLLPDVNREDHSLEGVVGRVTEEAFEESIRGHPFILTCDSSLAASGKCIALPESILEVWPPRQAAALFDDNGRPVLSRQISPAHRKRLLSWNAVAEIDKPSLLTVLTERHLPRPESWQQLLNLWAYLAPDITAYWPLFETETLRIVPVQGQDVLYSAQEVVRLGDKRLLDSDNDWQFLAEHLLVLHHSWMRFLADQRRLAEERTDVDALNSVKRAQAVLEKIGLDESADVDTVINRVAAEFFARERVGLAECVQLAQMAAKLRVTVGDDFCYVTRDGQLCPSNSIILFDDGNGAEELVPESTRASLLLHPDYSSEFRSCTRQEWMSWVTSGRAKLHSLPPIAERRVSIYGRPKVEGELRRRGSTGSPAYQYKTHEFVIIDWDFEETYWLHWNELAKQNDRLWADIAERVLGESDDYWRGARSAEARHVATNRSTRAITTERLLPSWVLRLRDMPCIRDTRGVCRKPGELLRRTPETEPFLDVEPFVHGSIDSEASRPLLDLLGVRSNLAGPDRLLDCLRTLAMSKTPPVHEVERWYRRLDQMVDTCSTEDVQKIKAAVRTERLILTAEGVWANVAGVFLSSAEEDAPGAAIIRESVANLSMWRKLGVAERPTADLAIAWLNALPSGRKLPSEDLSRVRALLSRYPQRIWEECGHWINLAGEWAATDGLSYALTMQSLIPWSHLHEWAKQKTADFQRLPVEVTGVLPFAGLPALVTRLEERFHRDPQLKSEPEERTWLTTVGTELCRVDLDTLAETDRVRTLAKDLAATLWHRAPKLEIIPYIDGTPAGTPRRSDVLWLGCALYLSDLPKAKLAKRIPEEIAKTFSRPDIKAALDYSFERPSEDVRAYLEENFTLVAAEDTLDVGPSDGAPAHAVVSSRAEQDATNRSDAPAVTGGDSVVEEGIERGTTTEGRLSEEGLTAAGGIASPRVATQRANKPAIIELFAIATGFRHDSEDRFFHPDGSWIRRTHGERFPWERRTASGDLVCYYWAKDHCLDREPLVLEAAVWGLIDSKPDLYSLILADSNGNPIEVPGIRLRAQKDAQKLKLYPAAYRLVIQEEENA